MDIVAVVQDNIPDRSNIEGGVLGQVGVRRGSELIWIWDRQTYKWTDLGILTPSMAIAS